MIRWILFIVITLFFTAATFHLYTSKDGEPHYKAGRLIVSSNEQYWVDQKRRVMVRQERYFGLLKNDLSIEDGKVHFRAIQKPLIVIFKKNEPIQEIQFADDGDHYRIQLPNTAAWAYFYHPGVLEKMRGNFR